MKAKHVCRLLKQISEGGKIPDEELVEVYNQSERDESQLGPYFAQMDPETLALYDMYIPPVEEFEDVSLHLKVLTDAMKKPGFKDPKGVYFGRYDELKQAQLMMMGPPGQEAAMPEEALSMPGEGGGPEGSNVSLQQVVPPIPGA